MKKRMFGLLLTLTMVIGLFPATVLAAPSDLQTKLDGYAEVYTGNDTNWWGTSAEFWNAVGMSAYEANGDVHSLTDAQKQALGNHLVTDAVTAMNTPEWNTQAGSINAVQSAVNGLAALGYDPNNVTDIDGAKIDLIGSLKTVTDMTADSMMYYSTIAPYTLLALQQGDYDATAAITAHVDYLTPLVGDTASWWGADSGAMMMQALVPYYNTDANVASAIDAAIVYFDTMHSETASYGNAPADAMVMVALAMMGIDVTTDSRFTAQNGATLYDGLMTYALSDGTGFDSRYQDWTTFEWVGVDVYNQRATDQAFLALVALNAVSTTGNAFNPFDCTAVAKDAFALTTTATETPAPEDTNDDNAEISAQVTVKTHNATWLTDVDVTLSEGNLVCDALASVFAGNGITAEGLADGYITALTKDGTTLAQYDEGPLSGWKYSVNGIAPQVGIDSAVVADGDQIVFYFTTDFTKDEADALPFHDVTSNDWFYDAVQYAYTNKLFEGTDTHTFAPNNTMNRAMLITVLHRMSGDTSYTGDTSSWYTNALAWGIAEGITDGSDLDSFASREQIVTMLWRMEGKPVSTADLSDYADASSISDWASSAMAWAVAEGIIEGRDGNTLAPTTYANRAETATLMMRYLTK